MRGWSAHPVRQTWVCLGSCSNCHSPAQRARHDVWAVLSECHHWVSRRAASLARRAAVRAPSGRWSVLKLRGWPRWPPSVRAAPPIACSGECGSHRCARTVDLQLMHLPQRARRLSFSLSASFFWDAPPVDFGAGVSIASSTQDRDTCRGVGGSWVPSKTCI